MSDQKTTVAYFDFDGTISSSDTLVPFLIHAVGYKKFILNLPCILSIAFCYIIKSINNEKAKERVITLLLKGMTLESLDRMAQTFVMHKLPQYIKSDILAKIEYHKKLGHRVILVSANLSIYLRYFVKQHQLDDVIGTQLEVIDVLVTGKLATRNCYGIEKINRIKRYLSENNIIVDYSYGYGNSKGDYELLNFVNEGYWIKHNSVTTWYKSRC